VARLEMARITSCHATDVDALGPDAIGRVMTDPAQLAQQVVEMHPSVHFLSSSYSIFSLWAAHQGVLDIADVDPDIAQQVLVFRDGLDVQTLQIPFGAYCFLTRLHCADTLAEAAGAAADADAHFDLSGAIALLLRHPLAIGMDAPP
jgi:hypothetical protein